jgi:hypothetical protein
MKRALRSLCAFALWQASFACWAFAIAYAIQRDPYFTYVPCAIVSLCCWYFSAKLLE